MMSLLVLLASACAEREAVKPKVSPKPIEGWGGFRWRDSVAKVLQAVDGGAVRQRQASTVATALPAGQEVVNVEVHLPAMQWVPFGGLKVEGRSAQGEFLFINERLAGVEFLFDDRFDNPDCSPAETDLWLILQGRHGPPLNGQWRSGPGEVTLKCDREGNNQRFRLKLGYWLSDTR